MVFLTSRTVVTFECRQVTRQFISLIHTGTRTIAEEKTTKVYMTIAIDSKSYRRLMACPVSLRTTFILLFTLYFS